jgi:hypothetical protein
MKSENKPSHIIELCKELIDDIELSRIDSKAILLKAKRLAYISGANEIKDWLEYEIYGYNYCRMTYIYTDSTQPFIRKYITRTDRWIDVTNIEIYSSSLELVEQAAKSFKENLDTLVNTINKQTSQDTLDHIKELNTKIAQLQSIYKHVIGLIHDFAIGVYYQNLFSGYSESIFEKYKESIDVLLADKCNDVFLKIPSIFERLSNGENEAISHALTTCRRIIDSFADAIKPPSEEEIEIDGNTLKLDASKSKNRINAYIQLKINSKSRKKKLRDTLENLYSRVCSGVHSDVSINEAKALFLEVYLFLGEVLSLENDQIQ